MRRLEAAIAALPLAFREVLILRDLQGLEYREIAEVTTLPVGTVVESIHANHAYNQLTRVLCNGGGAAPADESIFTLDAATSLAITSNPGGGGQRRQGGGARPSARRGVA